MEERVERGASSAPFPLEQLTPELKVLVFMHLPGKDIVSIRLVCREYNVPGTHRVTLLTLRIGVVKVSITGTRKRKHCEGPEDSKVVAQNSTWCPYVQERNERQDIGRAVFSGRPSCKWYPPLPKKKRAPLHANLAKTR